MLSVNCMRCVAAGESNNARSWFAPACRILFAASVPFTSSFLELCRCRCLFPLLLSFDDCQQLIFIPLSKCAVVQPQSSDRRDVGLWASALGVLLCVAQVLSGVAQTGGRLRDELHSSGGW